jgi:hypothetical protein
MNVNVEMDIQLTHVSLVREHFRGAMILEVELDAGGAGSNGLQYCSTSRVMHNLECSNNVVRDRNIVA